MMSRSILLRGTGVHTFIVVHHSSHSGGVLQRKPASSFASLRVPARRLVPVAGRRWIVSSSGTCRGRVRSGSRWGDHRITRHRSQSSSHSERLGDGDLVECRLGFCGRALALAKPVGPLNRIYMASCDRGLQPTVRIAPPIRGAVRRLGFAIPRLLLTGSCRGHIPTISPLFSTYLTLKLF
jgi:hypothetical protein